MSVKDRKAYLRAVVCLQATPPNNPARGARTLFEEFQLTHILLTERVHTVVRSASEFSQLHADISSSL